MVVMAVVAKEVVATVEVTTEVLAMEVQGLVSQDRLLIPLLQ